MMMTTDTVAYVYDGQEVILTGRQAVKKVENRYKKIEQVLVEVTPVDPDITWKKFVKRSELYEIT